MVDVKFKRKMQYHTTSLDETALAQAQGWPTLTLAALVLSSLKYFTCRRGYEREYFEGGERIWDVCEAGRADDDVSLVPREATICGHFSV